MPRRQVTRKGPVVIEWHEAELERFRHDPNGPLGRDLMRTLGEVVLKGAQRRALRRSGRMADEMYSTVEVDEDGEIMAAVVSPAKDPKSHNFPYAIVHEGQKVRDRRPHRSLRPAMRDIRKIAYLD